MPRVARPQIRRCPWKKSGFIVDGLRDDQGKRFRRFFGKREDAKTWLDRHQEKTSTEGRAGLSFTEPQRADARRALAELRDLPGASLTDAARHYAEYMRRAKSSVPVSELIKEFIAAKETDCRSKSYLVDLKWRLHDFDETFGAVIVGTITTREVGDWLRSLKLAPQTRANHRRVLHTFFEFAFSRGYASENPVARTDRPKVVRSEPGILTPSQLSALLSAADPKLLPALAIGAFAGLRPAEIRRLSWDAVNLEERFITVSAQTSKTASRRLVPITDNLLTWLMGFAPRNGNVLPSNDRTLMIAARRAANLPKWPHDALRHSWVTYRMALTGDEVRTAAEAGHSPAILHKHYRALATSAVAAQWFAVVPEEEKPKLYAFEQVAAQA